MIRDVPVRVAFEATDAFGNPVDVSGCILNKEKEVVSTFRTSHEGKGVFTYVADTEEVKAESCLARQEISLFFTGSRGTGIRFFG